MIDIHRDHNDSELGATESLTNSNALVLKACGFYATHDQGVNAQKAGNCIDRRISVIIYLR